MPRCLKNRRPTGPCSVNRLQADYITAGGATMATAAVSDPSRRIRPRITTGAHN